jgi:hypothetical protein
MKPHPFPADCKGLQIWRLNAGGACANAVLIHPPRPQGSGQQIMVLAGSMIQGFEVDSCPKGASKIRAMLFGLGKVVRRPDGFRYLNEHVVFASPSQAANVVHGESKSGWLFWRLGNHWGMSLGDAVKRARAGAFSLAYYERPRGACEVPSRPSW